METLISPPQNRLPLAIEQKLLRNMGTCIDGNHNEITSNFKKPVLKLIRNHVIVNSVSVLDKPFVYVGSGHDIETPLFLGVHDIYMYDPAFRNAKALLSCIERLGWYADPLPAEGLIDPYVFEGVIKEGGQRIRVTFVPKVFFDERYAKMHSYPLFVPERKEQYGMIFSFVLFEPRWFSDHKVWDSLYAQGYMFNASTPTEFHGGGINHIFKRRIDAPEHVMPFLEHNWGPDRKPISFGQSEFDGLLVQKVRAPAFSN